MKRLHMQMRKKEKPAELPEAIFRSPAREMSMAAFAVGFLIRALLTALGSSAMILLWLDAAGLVSFGGEQTTFVLGAFGVFLTALLVTLVMGVSDFYRVIRWVVPAGCIALLALVLTIRFGNPFSPLAEAFRCLFNTVLRGVASRSASYAYLASYAIGSVTAYGYGGADAMLLLSTLLLTAVISALLSRLILNGIRPLSVTVVMLLLAIPVFVLNITRTNYGFALLLAFLTGCIGLWICDSRYLGRSERRREKRRRKAAIRAERRGKKQARRSRLQRLGAIAYYSALDRGETEAAARAARRAALAEDRRAEAAQRRLACLSRRAEAEKKRAERREALRVEKAERRRDAALPRDARRAAVAARKTGRQNIRAQRKAERRRAALEKREAKEEKCLLRRRGAAGGSFAGAISTLLALVTLWLLAFRCQTVFPAIPLLYNPISVVNEQLTAILTGGDIDLNELAKHQQLPELNDRDIDFKPFSSGKATLFQVRSSMKMALYLREWIGSRYDTARNAWSGLDTDGVDAYRKAFGAVFTPDALRTSFYRYLYPEALENLTAGVARPYYEQGFAVAQTGITRLSGRNYLMPVPTYLDTDLGILGDGTLLPNPLKSSLYYDGMYSSRNFRTDGTYSTVSFLTTMLYGSSVGLALSEDQKAFETAFIWTVAYETLREALEDDRTLPGREVRLPLLNAKVVIELNEDGVLDFAPFLEVCRSRMAETGMTEAGMAIVTRYVTEWDAEQRAAFFEAALQEMNYRAYVYGEDTAYTAPVGSAAVSALAQQILADSGLTVTKTDVAYTRFESPSSITPIAQKTEKNALLYTLPTWIVTDAEGQTLPLNNLVMAVIDYLCHEMTYTKTPQAPQNSAYQTVLEQFLFESQEGYCVHFATAAAALLREYGLAVRYCDGAVVTEFRTDSASGNLLPYTSRVTEESLHAWIEVYFDGIGWVQYECTPAYYSYVYANDADDPVKPPVEPDDPTPPVTNPPATEPPVTEPPVTEPTGEKEAEFVNLLPLVLTLLVLGGIAAGIWMLLSALRRAAAETAKARADAIDRARDPELFTDRRFNPTAVAHELTDDLFRMFAAIGVRPEAGELSENFGQRLGREYGQLSGRDPVSVMRVIQKAEFGNGPTREELCLLAGYTEDAAAGIWQGLSTRDRLLLRYIKHLF